MQLSDYSRASAAMNRKLSEIAVATNSFLKYLKADSVELVDGSKILPRHVQRAHYVAVLPERVPHPKLVAVSQACLKDLDIAVTEADKPEFVQFFSGNKLIPGMDQPYCTAYGTHSYSQWFGQMGDGRAIYIGETHVQTAETEQPDDSFYSLGLRELQLKGAGRSPFSRGFDGRAVLRSSVREFLVSEAMHRLGVPTTRALTLATTGQAVRSWYRPPLSEVVR